MNDARRKQLEKALQLLEEAREIIESTNGEEQEAFENLPTSLQEGDNGQKMDEAISNMDDALSDIENAICGIENAKS